MLGKLLAELRVAKDAVVAMTAKTKEQLAQRWQPQEMLTFWLPVLEQRGPKDLDAKAVTDAERVGRDANATPAQKARCRGYQGLGAAKRREIRGSQGHAGKGEDRTGQRGTAFLNATEAGLKEASNPGVLYLARAEALPSRENMTKRSPP